MEPVALKPSSSTHHTSKGRSSIDLQMGSGAYPLPHFQALSHGSLFHENH